MEQCKLSMVYDHGEFSIGCRSQELAVAELDSLREQVCDTIVLLEPRWVRPLQRPGFERVHAVVIM